MSNMDTIKKVLGANDKYRCKIKTGKQDDADKVRGAIVCVAKDSMWNLKRHILRNHEDTMKEIKASEEGFSMLLFVLQVTAFINHETVK